MLEIINTTTILTFLDLFGTFFFAISGAFRAVKYEFDLLGVLVLSIAVGVGGGIMRDIILGIYPPAALSGNIYMLVCVAGGLLVFLFAPKIATKWNLVILADALGLGVFAALGASKAELFGVSTIMGVILCGTISAVGGGIIRDILSGEVPIILKTGFYASSAILGSAFYWLLAKEHFPFVITFVLAAGSTTMFRLLALRYNFELPHVRRLSVSPSELANQNRDKHTLSNK